MCAAFARTVQQDYRIAQVLTLHVWHNNAAYERLVLTREQHAQLSPDRGNDSLQVSASFAQYEMAVCGIYVAFEWP